MKISAINTYSYIKFGSTLPVNDRSEECFNTREILNTYLDKIMFYDKDKMSFDDYLNKIDISTGGLLCNMGLDLGMYAKFDTKKAMTPQDLKEIFQSHILTDEEISKMLPKPNYINHPWEIEGAKYKLKFLSDMFSELCKIIDETPQKDGKNIVYYFSDVTNKYFQQKTLEHYNRQESINSKLKYTDELPVNEEVELSEEDKAYLKRYLYNRSNFDMSIIAENWKREYTTENINVLSHKQNKAVLQEFPFYSTKKKMTPIVRWMLVQNFDEFQKEIPDVGEVLTFNSSKSCSKNFNYAEGTFSDMYRKLNVKYIIYPKNEKVSKARNLGFHEFGCSEVMYPQGAKFRILHKGFEENTLLSPTRYSSNIRYLVYMQEV